jgi:hypothetical protein
VGRATPRRPWPNRLEPGASASGRAVVQQKEADVTRDSMVDLEETVLAPTATASPVVWIIILIIIN